MTSTYEMSNSPAGTEPGVSCGPLSGLLRWDEGVEVDVQPLLVACVMVALARHVLGCPSRLSDRAGRKPLAAIRPAPVRRRRGGGSSASRSRR